MLVEEVADPEFEAIDSAKTSAMIETPRRSAAVQDGGHRERE